MTETYYLDKRNAAFAMAYVIKQPCIMHVYSPEDALKRGTLFPELDKPFMAYKGAV